MALDDNDIRLSLFVDDIARNYAQLFEPMQDGTAIYLGVSHEVQVDLSLRKETC